MRRFVPTTQRRALAAVAAVAAAAVTLTGCLYAAIPEETTGASSTPSPSTGTGLGAGLGEYYAQDVDWSACGEFDCATVLAPLDWDDPEAASIELAITRHPAAGGQAQGSLLTNPGGPGAGGVDFVQENLTYVFGEDLIDQFDIVGFDPRGVGSSTAVHCFDDAEMDAYLYDIPDAERGTDAWEQERTAANERFADACEQNSDGILEHITTVDSARDMDLLRAVLGDDKLTYLGYSYGTFLGATYAELYPQNVGRLVLDGAIDPSISGLDVSTEQAIGFENALRAYMADCLAGAECPFRGTVDQAMADLGALLASVDRDPLPSSDGRFLGADTLMTAIILPLYSQANWPALTQVLTAALSGDADYPFFIADLYNDREDGTYTSNSTEAFRAYNCMDYPADVTPAEQDAADALIAEKAPTIAPYWDGPDPCDVWPYEPTGTRGPIAAEGAAPIVVVGTTGDPATPYAWSVALADQLSSGVLVTHQGEGHTGYLKGDGCVDRAVEAYLLSGTVPDDGACGA